MKTKLLLLMLLLTSTLSFAQINVSESFETAIPTGWTTTGGFDREFDSTYSCDQYYSLTTYITTTNRSASIITPSYVSSGKRIIIGYKYKRDISFYGTANIEYEINNSGTWVYVTGSAVFNTGCNVIESTIASGVIPLGANVKFRFQINCPNAVGLGINVDDITINQRTAVVDPPALIAEYNFDNTLNDVNGANPFALQTGMLYGTDRAGSAGKSLYIDGTGTTASLTTLPVSNSSRTFSIWFKPSQVNSDNRIFSYGSASGSLAYGASFVADRVYNFSYTSSFFALTPTAVSVWKHLVCTYEESTGMAKIYINGEFKSSSTFTAWDTSDGGVLYLGSLFGGTSGKYSGYVDDLKIYNYALSDAEVTNLFDNNITLSSQDFDKNDLKVSLYPNPVKDILHIETPEEIKSVTVFGILGNTVLTSTSKEVNVSNLSKGTYMVRVEDAKNAVSTKKIIKQ